LGTTLVCGWEEKGGIFLPFFSLFEVNEGREERRGRRERNFEMLGGWTLTVFV